MKNVQQIKQLREQLNLLINEGNKPLTSKEVLALSRQLDKIVVAEMKVINEYEVDE